MKVKEQESPYTFISSSPEALMFKSPSLLITIMGGVKITGLDRLRITLKINHAEEEDSVKAIRYNIDLYQSDSVEKLISKVSEQFDISILEVSKTIAQLIDTLEKYRIEKLEEYHTPHIPRKEPTKEEIRDAIRYLSQPNLMERTNTDIGKSGLVGEEHNRLLIYLIFTSRKRENPLHVICLGQSGMGKTYLQSKVAELIPSEEKIEITSFSKNAFYYFQTEELRNKVMLIEDLDGVNDEESWYALRELQSKQRITKTVAMKDSKGVLKTFTLKVEGPVSVAGCTTKEKLYEDNQNRCVLIHVDTSKKQDQKIMDYQKRVSAGEINTKEQKNIKDKFKNIQRVLRPIKVVNPFASKLKLPDQVFKPRRTMTIYLALIETITFYHQYNRPLKKDKITGEEYIETSQQDIQWANTLLKDTLLRKSDELSGACRAFFEELKTYLIQKKEESFYSRDIRYSLRIHNSSVKRYLNELEKGGYIKIIGGSKFKGFEYAVNNMQEFKTLQEEVETTLNETLNKLKK
jgi:hypothetical protein